MIDDIHLQPTGAEHVESQERTNVLNRPTNLGIGSVVSVQAPKETKPNKKLPTQAEYPFRILAQPQPTLMTTPSAFLYFQNTRVKPDCPDFKMAKDGGDTACLAAARAGN